MEPDFKAPWENGGKVSIIFQRHASGAEWWGVYSGKELVALVKEPANARLIKSAPDMYEVLAAIARYDFNITEGARRLIRDALAQVGAP